MKVSFIVPCRDKAGFVEKTVRTVLDQTYSPMEIVLSDQGSVDGSFDILTSLAANYTGPNTVRVLQCPHTEMRGMAGLNNHLNWIHEQIDGDVVIMCSADDLNHPERARFTVEAFEKHNPSYVGTSVQYMNPDLIWHGEQTAYQYDGKFVEEDGFVDPPKCVSDLIASSASSAWARDLWDKYAPLTGIESQDMILPHAALWERGLWFIAKNLHAYIRHADEGNTGLEGCLRAAKTDREKQAWVELINFHCTSNYFAILRRITQHNIKVEPNLYHAIMDKAVQSANQWCIGRDCVIMNRIQPKMMKV